MASASKEPASPQPQGGGQNGSDGEAGVGDDQKPRLTEAEKKQNHIASEQKRRQAIREGFDRLTELVPGLEGQGRSEGLVLQRTVKYMHEQLDERRALIARIEELGGTVDHDLKQQAQQSSNKKQGQGSKEQSAHRF